MTESEWHGRVNFGRVNFSRVNFGRIGSPWPNHHDRIRMAWPSELWPTPRIIRPNELGRLRAYFGRVNFSRVNFGWIGSPWPKHHDRIRMAWPSELWPTPRILRPSELWPSELWPTPRILRPSHLGRLRQYLVESPWLNTKIFGRVPLTECNNTWPSTLGRIREYLAENNWTSTTENSQVNEINFQEQ